MTTFRDYPAPEIADIDNDVDFANVSRNPGVLGLGLDLPPAEIGPRSFAFGPLSEDTLYGAPNRFDPITNRSMNANANELKMGLDARAAAMRDQMGVPQALAALPDPISVRSYPVFEPPAPNEITVTPREQPRYADVPLPPERPYFDPPTREERLGVRPDGSTIYKEVVRPSTVFGGLANAGISMVPGGSLANLAARLVTGKTLGVGAFDYLFPNARSENFSGLQMGEGGEENSLPEALRHTNPLDVLPAGSSSPAASTGGQSGSGSSAQQPLTYSGRTYRSPSDVFRYGYRPSHRFYD
jgi:hypothetical protein